MGEAARALDILDVSPAFVQEDADALNARFADVPTLDMLRELLTGELKGRVAAVSSFGAESAVLLDLIASVDPSVPVIFINTQKMFGETLAYRDAIAERLGLLDLRVFRPDPLRIAARDPTGLRWSFDPDECCEIRKVEPLARALVPFDAWISGRKGFQSKSRKALSRFEVEDGRLKLNPLADWTKADLDRWFEARKLPRHPLEAEGFLSIGCQPCTSAVRPGEDPRAGRWRGWDKVECGLHSPAHPNPDEPAF